MQELHIFMVPDGGSVSTKVENTVGEMKTTHFKRLGIDRVNYQYLSDEATKLEHVKKYGVRMPAFVLRRNGEDVSVMNGFISAEVFGDWLRKALAS